ncbi:unnamed protein product [Rotaria sordida]|uniref:Peptidyl-prolyl cis-trans isomerase n=1 Tax=Rotaria sordida TaxID=392033 RepID=A0A819Z0X7_9BILA|nr:unnamed protein product [Rotaria sordida]CAF4166912.1 unnamed protein product [Rotaria sordida]
MSILYKLFFILTLYKLSINGYPSSYCIHFDTNVKDSKNPIIINITQSWSPIGANHLYDIINSNFYSLPSAFFRVVPNFVVQFGISGDPIQNIIWNQPIQDDPVKMSNIKGTLSYATAGPNTRTTQLFINYVDNPRLDSLGFSPLGIVTTGFDTALAIFNPTPGSSDGVDQDQYSEKGNQWIIDNYPQINFIEKVSIIDHCPFTN